MLAGINGWQLVIILVLVVLLFAAPKLPAMARNLGQSMRIFSSEVKEMRAEGKEKKASSEADGQTVAGETVEDRGQARETGSHSAGSPSGDDR